MLPTLLLVATLSVPADVTVVVQDHVIVTITRGAEPKLEFDVDVPAPVEDVWTAMSTAEGLKTWIAPDARVDLREGGDWLAMFPGVAPGGGRITRVEPLRTLAIHAMAPEKFGEVRKVGTEAVFSFEKLTAKNTHVHLAQTGWREGKEWSDAFDYLSKGNAVLLNMLRQRFIDGPQKWPAAAK